MEQATNLAYLSLTEASDLISRRKVSPRELTRVCLDRIERLNPGLNAFITVTSEQALDQAEQLEDELRQGRRRGPLHGIPVALKDNVDTAGVPTTAASAVFADRVPTEDAEVVLRLKEAGAVLLGKLNMHEFAYGTTSVISHYGAVHNPWNRDRIAGGSSGGSAAAVAAGLCYGALGTDTGGSIRLPAACCGIVGLKPTYGLVSARGVVPLSWTLDHVGPMCRTVADAALLLAALAGYDPQDEASAEIPMADYPAALGRRRESLRVGVLRLFEPSDEARGSLEAAWGVLRSLGASLLDVELDVPEAAYRVVVFAEANAYHAARLETARDLYAPETRARLEGTAGVSAAEYIAARREIEHARRTAGRLFREVDLLVSPTTPVAALRIDECRWATALPLQFTSPFNLLGLPAISVPCGLTTDGLPLGLQIAGPRGGEAAVLAAAHHFEQATPWHSRRPPV